MYCALNFLKYVLQYATHYICDFNFILEEFSFISGT